MFTKLKKIPRRRLLEVVITILSAILLFVFFKNEINYMHGLQVLGSEDQKEQGIPKRVVISKINVDTAIESVGLNSKGEMAVPSTTSSVGWFNLGVRPGEQGSAVIDGHVDGQDGEQGVFADLDKLKPGDTMYTVDDKGLTTVFVVRAIKTFNPGYVPEVFTLNDTAHLNLVTCDGIWNASKKSYTKRLVVFTDIVH